MRKKEKDDYNEWQVSKERAVEYDKVRGKNRMGGDGEESCSNSGRIRLESKPTKEETYYLKINITNKEESPRED